MQVLELEEDADEAAVRKARRKRSLATHPDKCSCPGAQQAFQVRMTSYVAHSALFCKLVLAVTT